MPSINFEEFQFDEDYYTKYEEETTAPRRKMMKTSRNSIETNGFNSTMHSSYDNSFEELSPKSHHNSSGLQNPDSFLQFTETTDSLETTTTSTERVVTDGGKKDYMKNILRGFAWEICENQTSKILDIVELQTELLFQTYTQQQKKSLRSDFFHFLNNNFITRNGKAKIDSAAKLTKFFQSEVSINADCVRLMRACLPQWIDSDAYIDWASNRFGGLPSTRQFHLNAKNIIEFVRKFKDLEHYNCKWR